jgi:large subunit ribosomal protein L10
MSKKIKEMELNDLRATFKGVKDLVVLQPLKLDSAADYEMRKKLRDKKIRVKLVKNSLIKKVFDENGVKVDAGAGATLLCWGAESVKELSTTVESILKDLKKDPKAPDKIKVKTAVSEGQAVTMEVAKNIPTRQEAIGGVIAALLGPGSQIAGCLTGPAGQLAGILVAIEEKGKSAPAVG